MIDSVLEVISFHSFHAMVLLVTNARWTSHTDITQVIDFHKSGMNGVYVEKHVNLKTQIVQNLT